VPPGMVLQWQGSNDLATWTEWRPVRILRNGPPGYLLAARFWVVDQRVHSLITAR
jgi:hypothetical protein